MHLAVSTQTAGVFKGLATLFAHIWSLPCVLPQVVLVVRAPLESERTVGALECPNTCVYLGKVKTGGNTYCHSVFLLKHNLTYNCKSISWMVIVTITYLGLYFNE